MTKIIITNTTSRIEEASEGQLSRVNRALSVEAPGHKYTYLYKKKLWDGKVRILTKDNEFPTGIIDTVIKALGGKVSLEDNRFIRPLSLQRTTLPLRDYQLDAVKQALENKKFGAWWPRGVIKSPTGSGKTFIATALVQKANVPTMILVDSNQLANQMRATIEEYVGPTGYIKNGEVHGNEDCIISTVQSVMSWAHQTKKTKARTDEDVDRIEETKNEKKQRILRILERVEQVILDEAHVCGANLDKGNLFSRAVSLMTNAYMRWGLTATPFMRSFYDDYLLEGATGSIVFSITSKELIKLGHLVPPDITIFSYPPLSLPKEIKKDYHASYSLGIVHNDKRNKKIVDIIEENEGPIVVLIQLVEHGDILKSMCKKRGISVEFLYGKVPDEEREKVKKDLAQGRLKVVIGSRIWDKGIDIKEVRTLILAGGGKKEYQNLQRLGRGLRPDKGKTSVKVFDFNDTSTPTLRNHSRIRKSTWLSEGYEVTESFI